MILPEAVSKGFEILLGIRQVIFLLTFLTVFPLLMIRGLLNLIKDIKKEVKTGKSTWEAFKIHNNTGAPPNYGFIPYSHSSIQSTSTSTIDYVFDPAYYNVPGNVNYRSYTYR